MAAVDGFRAESRNGLLGWVEETWLGDEDEADALALRLVDGRRGLVLAADVEAVVPEREYVSVRSGARILELGTPHVVRRAVDGGPPRVAASWQTTGESASTRPTSANPSRTALARNSRFALTRAGAPV